jgi:hypothetical protein
LATLLGAVYHQCIRWELQRATLHPVVAEVAVGPELERPVRLAAGVFNAELAEKLKYGLLWCL